MTMSIKALLVAAFAATLLICSPALAADDSCNATQSMCAVQTNTPMRLAADYAVKPGNAAKLAQCTGMSGVAQKKCKCEAQGEPGFPCHFRPGSGSAPSRCLCE
jgi:hypothetical protein